MEMIYLAIIGFIVGAITDTLVSFGWKKYQDDITFSLDYIISMLCSMVLTILLSPILFITGIQSSDLIFTMAGTFGLGFTMNVLVNKPFSYVIKRLPSTMEMPDSKKFIKYVFVFFLIGAVGGTTVFAAAVYNAKVGSHGKVKAVGCGVFSDAAGTNPLTDINWGIVEPGQQIPVNMFIKATGNTPITLTLRTEKYDPVTAEQYLSLTWNYDGAVIQPGQIKPVTVTLTVSAAVTGITDFSFDIIITSTG